MVARAAGRVIVVAGGGVTDRNAARILRESGVAELHCSARTALPSAMQFRNTAVLMGAALAASEFEHKVASAARVAEVRHHASS